MKNWQRPARMAAVVLLAVAATGCIVLPFGGGRGHRGHHMNDDGARSGAAPHADHSTAPGRWAPPPYRGR